jgi:hypothetical protein
LPQARLHSTHCRRANASQNRLDCTVGHVVRHKRGLNHLVNAPGGITFTQLCNALCNVSNAIAQRYNFTRHEIVSSLCNLISPLDCSNCSPPGHINKPGGRPGRSHHAPGSVSSNHWSVL